MSIALLIMCKDEFNKVKGIIKTIESVCKEKIVVITGNKRVKESGDCKILYYPWHDDYSTPLNAGLRLIKSDWVLRLDADEEIDEINLKRVLKAVEYDVDVWAYEVSQRGYLPSKGSNLGLNW